MISPDAFERTHKRCMTDIIRVALEPRGVIGFIDVHESTSLLDARALICENVENAPSTFQFVLDDGAPVSARQEATQKISSFYPCVKIRDCTTTASISTTGKNPTATSQSPVSPRAATDDGSDNESSLTDDFAGPSAAATTSGTTEKITVHSSSGSEFTAWISKDYTFQQLRRDASKYWNLQPAHVALTDADGCLWPEQARILSVMSIDELHRKRVVLELKAGGTSSSSATTRSKHLARAQSGSQSMSATSIRHTLLRGDSTRGGSLARAQSATAIPTSHLSLSVPAAAASTAPSSLNVVEELWLIFTFYCVHGDSLDLECMKAHQFNKLLRDARLFGGSLTPAIADIIYTSETKGKPHTSGKMNYDEFLNALMKIAATKHKAKHKHKAKSKAAMLLSTAIDEDDEADQCFQALVVDHILPLASRWPTHTWDAHTQRLRQPDVVTFVSKFLEPLLAIFQFYARSHVVAGATSGAKEFYMSYSDYQRFFNDFAFANLQVSSVDAAQVFLAACSSSPFHAVYNSADAMTTTQSPLSMTSDTTIGADLSAAAAAIQHVFASADGVVAYAFPETQIGRVGMGVSAFLDALGRIGLVAFAPINATLKTLHCVKAIFHHVSRGLSRTRVQEILRNHSSTSIHATKFYSGTVAFNNRFLDMWRYEGSPDYLAGSLYSLNGTASSLASFSGDALARSSADLLTSGYTNNAVNSNGVLSGSAGARSPVASPTRRLMMTSSMFDDRVISTGAGRGREALDRLVRDAIFRGAAADTSNAVAVDAAEGSTARLTSPATSPTNRRSRVGSPRPRSDAAKSDVAAAESESESEQPSANVDSATSLRSDSDDQQDDGNDKDSEQHELTDHTRVNDVPGIDDVEDDGSSEQIGVLRPHSPINTHVQVRPVPTSPSSPLHTTALAATATGAHTTVPSSPPPPMLLLRRDDERVLFESILLKGGVFKKYGQWGNPHRRYVWCAKDFDAVYWRPLNRKNSLAKEGIAVASVIAVLPGNSMRTRYAFMKHLSDEKSLCRCFSVVAEDRRLDLEADSESTRDLWMNAFLYLMKEHRPRQLVA